MTRLLTGVLSALLASALLVPSAAQASPAHLSDSRSRVLEAVKWLGTRAATPMRLTSTSSLDMPLTASLAANGDYSIKQGSSAQMVVGGTEYDSADRSLRAQAALAGRDTLTWYSAPVISNHRLDVPSILSPLEVFAKFGHVDRVKGGFRVWGDFRDRTLPYRAEVSLAQAHEQRQGSWLVRTNRAGRISSVTGVGFYLSGERRVPVHSRVTFAYAPVTVNAPASSAVISVLEAASLPSLSPLERAAYETAQGADELALPGVGVDVDAIEQAALDVPTPPGLTAFYVPSGLRYVLDGVALCITPSADRSSALVLPC